MLRWTLSLGLVLSLSQAWSANLCSDIFSGGKSALAGRQVSDRLTELEPLRASYREQRARGLSPESIQLPVTEFIFENLNDMTKALHKVQLPYGKNLPPESADRLHEVIAQLQLQLEVMSTQKTINYFEYLKVSERFTRAVSLPYARRVNEKFLTEQMSRIEGSFADSIVNEFRPLLLTDAKDRLFMPSMRPYNIEQINELQAADIAVVGITTQVMLVDAIKYNPDLFFRHDILHGIAYEGHSLFRAGEMKDLPRLSQDQRWKFYQGFVRWIQESGVDARTKAVRQILWFTTFHEDESPIHPQNLSSRMKFYSEEGLAHLQTRVNDPIDMGHAFTKQALTLEELTQEIRKVQTFAEQFKF